MKVSEVDVSKAMNPYTNSPREATEDRQRIAQVISQILSIQDETRRTLLLIEQGDQPETRGEAYPSKPVAGGLAGQLQAQQDDLVRCADMAENILSRVRDIQMLLGRTL